MLRKGWICLVVIVIGIVACGYLLKPIWEPRQLIEAFQNNSNVIVFVDLTTQRLDCIDEKTLKIIKTYKIAGGTANTPSPIGTFQIIFKAAWGEGFGTRFMGINVPWGKYVLEYGINCLLDGTKAYISMILGDSRLKKWDRLYKYI